MELWNGANMWKDKNKPGPSGRSCIMAFSLLKKWGGHNYLLLVDVKIVCELKEALGDDALLDFVAPKFAEQAKAAYQTLNISKLKFDNVWDVFSDMLSLLYPFWLCSDNTMDAPTPKRYIVHVLQDVWDGDMLQDV